MSFKETCTAEWARYRAMKNGVQKSMTVRKSVKKSVGFIVSPSHDPRDPEALPPMDSEEDAIKLAKLLSMTLADRGSNSDYYVYRVSSGIMYELICKVEDGKCYSEDIYGAGDWTEINKSARNSTSKSRRMNRMRKYHYYSDSEIMDAAEKFAIDLAAKVRDKANSEGACYGLREIKFYPKMNMGKTVRFESGEMNGDWKHCFAHGAHLAEESAKELGSLVLNADWDPTHSYTDDDDVDGEVFIACDVPDNYFPESVENP